MKARKSLTLLLAALTMTACKYDDSALWEQVNQITERIAALEAWQAETNTNIQSLQTLLNTADYITAVTPITEEGVEVGYTITFLNSPAITIYHGQKGDKGDTGSIPQIGVTQGEDGNWYWTLNGITLTDDAGNPIRANGEKGDQGDTGDSAPLPQLKTGASLTVSQDTQGDAIEPNAMYLSVDGGQTWTRVSGDIGDSIFSKVDTTTDPTHVIFTLADGTTFSVLRYTDLKLNFDTSEVHLSYGETMTVNFTAEGSNEFTPDNLSIVTPEGWKASAALTRAASTAFTLTVTAPTDEASGADEGEILVTLDNGQGDTTLGRLTVTASTPTEGTVLTADALQPGELAKMIGSRTDLTSITVTSGTLDETDWAAIVRNKETLLYLDLLGVTYTGTDADKLVYNGFNYFKVPIEEFKLPQGITGLGEYAFHACDDITSVNLPDGVASIGAYAFNGCDNLTSVTLLDGVTNIGERAFNGCSNLTSVTLPEGLTSIGAYAFYNCYRLKSINLPNSLASIGNSAFSACTVLVSIHWPESLTSIGNFAFSRCNLSSIDLPDGLKSIGEKAFYQNSNYSLTSVTLPEGLENIGDYAFDDCSCLSSVTCLGLNPPKMGKSAFRNCPSNLKIYVPTDAVVTYQVAEGWSEYADVIQAIP
ncbi:MAG TPA: leucine-rich repeat protein [Candidatus Bacteroides merdavium]|uniref:Leucine-rich repeat protein n=1 Tax=Candidatus Bacteroides merdavium TaxID=2838472 RepID=A0A9D2KDG4_9BACE|nr:leucine-rich repeat protein [Candidatus Bacteroides merdavium]